MARPTVISSQAITALREAYLLGATDREACAYADISISALYRYQAQKPAFREWKAAWKSNPIMLAKKVVVEKIKGGDVKTAQWYLERKAKDEFSTREEVFTQDDGKISGILDRLEAESDYEEVARQAQKELERQNLTA